MKSIMKGDHDINWFTDVSHSARFSVCLKHTDFPVGYEFRSSTAKIDSMLHLTYSRLNIAFSCNMSNPISDWCSSWLGAGSWGVLTRSRIPSFLQGRYPFWLLSQTYRLPTLRDVHWGVMCQQRPRMPHQGMCLKVSIIIIGQTIFPPLWHIHRKMLLVEIIYLKYAKTHIERHFLFWSRLIPQVNIDLKGMLYEIHWANRPAFPVI